MYVAVMTRSSSQYDLLRGGAELVDLSMLAARASAAARRLALGQVPDLSDVAVFTALADLLDAAAQSADFFDSAGTKGSAPSNSLAASVDATIDAVLETPAAVPTQTAPRLADLAERVRSIQHEPQRAGDVVDFFAALSASVLRQSSHSAEVTATL